MILCNNNTKNDYEIDMIKFRNKLYDIRIHNLDASKCIWYSFSYFTSHNYLQQENMTLYRYPTHFPIFKPKAGIQAIVIHMG